MPVFFKKEISFCFLLFMLIFYFLVPSKFVFSQNETTESSSPQNITNSKQIVTQQETTEESSLNGAKIKKKNPKNKKKQLQKRKKEKVARKKQRQAKREKKRKQQEQKAKAISDHDAEQQEKLDLTGKTPLPQKMLDDKREGFYWTGIAGPLYSPDVGFGFAGVVNYFRNGYRNEPTFPYVPYRENVMLTLGSSTKGVHSYWVNYNAPYLRNTILNLRFHAGVYHNIVSPYYGLGNETQKNLTHPDGTTYTRFKDYNNAIRKINGGKTWSYYNFYAETKPETHIQLEYNFLGGKIRLLTALTISYFRIKDYSGQKVSAGDNSSALMRQTLLSQDNQAQKILGYNGGFDNYLTVGFIYDTRDFQPDPSRGMYHELTYSQSAKIFGSAYNYYDVTFTLRGYRSLFPRHIDMVLAARFSYHIKGMDVPFYVMKRLIYAEANVIGLGGMSTLRGFADARFAGPVMLLANFELRYTFARVQVKKNILKFKLVPFVEFGRSYDSPQETTLRGLNVAGGIGFKMSWNLASIIALDLGFSKENISFYFSYGNIF